jgi:hypothetical protein
MVTGRDEVETLWAEISAEAKRLGALDDGIRGCRFLYSARSTFTKNTGILIAGINPGGQVDMRDRPYPEDGINSYLSEDWGRSPYQGRMVRFMRNLYGHYGIADPDEAINSTLTSNFSPFRSPQWNAISSDVRRQARTFSTNLWKRILPLSGVRVVISGGDVATDGFSKVCYDLGMPLPIGIPHASRFDIDSHLARVITGLDALAVVPVLPTYRH